MDGRNHAHILTVPVPGWVKAAIDEWTTAVPYRWSEFLGIGSSFGANVY